MDFGSFLNPTQKDVNLVVVTNKEQLQRILVILIPGNADAKDSSLVPHATSVRHAFGTWAPLKMDVGHVNVILEGLLVIYVMTLPVIVHAALI
jgi:2'-5' RNA ligase